jgi:hypothetical protein
VRITVDISPYHSVSQAEIVDGILRYQYLSCKMVAIRRSSGDDENDNAESGGYEPPVRDYRIHRRCDKVLAMVAVAHY